MKFFKETEKAGQVKMMIEWYNSERETEHLVWIPKSQIRNGKLTKWIANAKAEEKTFGRQDFFVSFVDADGNTIETESTAADRKAAKALTNDLRKTFGRFSFNAN